jgi:hypothetical protein
MPDVQTLGGGIKTAIRRNPLARQHIAKAFGGVVHEAAPGQLAI